MDKSKPDLDKAFSGAIPQVYEKLLVPLIFESYAADLLDRLKKFPPPERLLEIAAGTGVVTRALAAQLPETVSIVATDLNPAMLEEAAKAGTARPVEWRQADALHLPFADESFDAVICQFGVMFFPDKVRAFAEVRRVLRRDGVFIFNVWDRIAENELADTVTAALAEFFPDDPPRFMVRTPHGYYEHAIIERDLAAAGFASDPPRLETVTERSRAPSARVAAQAYCQGTPMRSEIEARAPARLAEATDAVERAIAARFGGGVVSGKIQAHVVTVRR